MSTTTWIHPDIIESHILNKLDGATLAAASCASSELLSRCTRDCLWMQVCNSTCPSTAHPAVRAAISSRHRSFYSDSFPAVRSMAARKTKYPLTSELISAVDIFYGDGLIYSKVLQTETLSGVFLCSAFRVDLLPRGESVAVPLKFDGECLTRAAEKLRVSWIVIDPSRGRAVSVASGEAVECVAEDMQIRYATVVGGGGGGCGDWEELVQFRVEVSCGGGYGGGDLVVKEVMLEIENTEGRVLTGFDSLVVIEAAMEGERERDGWLRGRK